MLLSSSALESFIAANCAACGCRMSVQMSGLLEHGV